MEVIRALLPYVQIATSVLLVVAILLQQKGAGLGAAFGGEGNVYRTKRGMEKTLFIGTIILALIFFITAFINLLII